MIAAADWCKETGVYIMKKVLFAGVQYLWRFMGFEMLADTVVSGFIVKGASGDRKHGKRSPTWELGDYAALGVYLIPRSAVMLVVRREVQRVVVVLQSNAVDFEAIVESLDDDVATELWMTGLCWRAAEDCLDFGLCSLFISLTDISSVLSWISPR